MKEIFVGELAPDETVDAMREAKLLSTVSLIYWRLLNIYYPSLLVVIKN